MPTKLPALFGAICEKVAVFRPYLMYYREVTGGGDLEALEYLIAEGDTTTKRWKGRASEQEEEQNRYAVFHRI